MAALKPPIPAPTMVMLRGVVSVVVCPLTPSADVKSILAWWNARKNKQEFETNKQDQENLRVGYLIYVEGAR